MIARSIKKEMSVRELITMRRWVVFAVVVVTLVLAACSSGSSLTGKTWQWISWTTVTPQSQSDVPDPSSYTIEFKSDGTFQAKADCNTAAGTYTSSASGGLKISVDPSALVPCAADSLSETFIEKLGLAISYTFFRSEMTINLQDLGTMQLK
jgi:heat shock protein HslJ